MAWDEMGMRILFVARVNSVHSAHWIGQLDGLGWDIHVFPYMRPGPQGIHPHFRNVTMHDCGLWRPSGTPSSVTIEGLWPFSRGAYRADRMLSRFRRNHCERARRLALTIARLRPDLIHSLEMQHASYLTLEAIRFLKKGRVPPWIYSSWGSDIDFFGRQEEHTNRVRSVLATCDYHVSDCERDIHLAQEFGFEGESLGVFPGPGGFPIEAMRRSICDTRTSGRRVIAVKGLQNWSGRGLVALEAIHRCADVLRDYEIVVYYTNNAPGVLEVANHIRRVTGLNIRILDGLRPHEEILSLMGRGRVALGLSVTDGMPNSMLEAMVMGAFPIPSGTGAISEWIEDGRNGLMVPPEDAMKVEQALRKAIADDDLVDNASVINLERARARLGESVVKPSVIAMYERVLN